jgi:hypothetical protein
VYRTASLAVWLAPADGWEQQLRVLSCVGALEGGNMAAAPEDAAGKDTGSLVHGWADAPAVLPHTAAGNTITVRPPSREKAP